MKSLSLSFVVFSMLLFTVGCGESSTVIQPADDAPMTETDQEMESDDYENEMKKMQ
ncbi:hypothetical protein RISK_000314 [Rhodopirellula islandica]|uniref:Signal peptide and transmembrane protein n=1 Tax=Rhodopirellula islandica TaxID=595434 RepID=A0A0J1BMC8_RHOIS|nr:hypothetical protein [Rhodopirellula islandica]KLU07637.1 hypothetical protein RISK_000314 [Rhodopirellula islandica]